MGIRNTKAMKARQRIATDEEVDRLNNAIAEDPMFELPLGIHRRLADAGLDTMAKVAKAFDAGDLSPGKLRNFGKGSYCKVAKWLGRAPLPSRCHNVSYIAGLERAFEILRLGANVSDLGREIKKLKKSLETKRNLERVEAKPAMTGYQPTGLWWSNSLKTKQ